MLKTLPASLSRVLALTVKGSFVEGRSAVRLGRGDRSKALSPMLGTEQAFINDGRCSRQQIS